MSIRLFEDDDGSLLSPTAGHCLIAGSSGTGKSMLTRAWAKARIANPLFAVIVIEPEGDLIPPLIEFVASPQSRLGQRIVHHLKPASENDAFALPMLQVPERTPQACHDKALRLLTIFEQAINFGNSEYGPRLSKLLYLGLLGLSLAGRPLIDLPDLFAQGAQHLRATIGAGFPYPFMRDEWQGFDALSDRDFLSYRDPVLSRLLPIFGNSRLRRTFGPQNPVDVGRILANREVALLELAGLEHKDAILVGKCFLSLLFHEALQRPVDTAPYATVFIDEVFDYVTVDFARGFDRLRKRHIQLVCAIQRLGQLS